MKINFRIYSLTLCVIALSYGCHKPEQYSVEPHIEFKEFVQMGDSGRISFRFTDGDGDIGLDEGDVTAPYTGKFYNNVFIRYYEKVNGLWQQGIGAAGPVEFTYRTEKLTPGGKNKAIRGEIIIYLVPIFYNDNSDDSDTIKFDIQLADRALHLSNIVESAEFVRQ